MSRSGFTLLAAAVAGVLLGSVPAKAQTEYSDFEDETVVASPEWGTWELFAVGPYQPTAIENANPPLASLADDKGPLLSSELDINVWRIPYVGPIQLGARFGWAKYEGSTTLAGDPTMSSGEKAKVVIFPFTPQAVLRIDVLARELGIPIIFAGKVGLQLIPWRSKKGGALEPQGKNVELGLRWGAQVALELDFLEPRAARRLDEEWGINHSFIFGEVFGSTADFFGDPFSWAMGLGLTF